VGIQNLWMIKLMANENMKFWKTISAIHIQLLKEALWFKKHSEIEKPSRDNFFNSLKP